MFVKVAKISSYTLRDLGLRHEVDENCPLLGYYAASSGNSLLTFQENLLALDSRPFTMGPIGCPEMMVRNCHYSLRNSPEEDSSLLSVLFIFLHKLEVRIYCISRTIKRTFFPEKCDLKLTCVLFAKGKYLFPNL